MKLLDIVILASAILGAFFLILWVIVMISHEKFKSDKINFLRTIAPKASYQNDPLANIQYEMWSQSASTLSWMVGIFRTVLWYTWITLFIIPIGLMLLR